MGDNPYKTKRQSGYGHTRPSNSGYKKEPGKVVPITPDNKPMTRHAKKVNDVMDNEGKTSRTA